MTLPLRFRRLNDMFPRNRELPVGCIECGRDGGTLRRVNSRPEKVVYRHVLCPPESPPYDMARVMEQLRKRGIILEGG